MKPEESRGSDTPHRLLKKLYVLLLAFLALTGFSQMPIFKRYYIADVPGLGWLADYYFTHTLHYLGAIVLLAVLGYYIIDFLFQGRKTYRLTATAYARMLLLAGLVGTGILRILKNLPDVAFSPGFTVFIDIAHLGFMMCFALAALVFMVLKKGWVVAIPGKGV